MENHSVPIFQYSSDDPTSLASSSVSASAAPMLLMNPIMTTSITTPSTTHDHDHQSHNNNISINGGPVPPVLGGSMMNIMSSSVEAPHAVHTIRSTSDHVSISNQLSQSSSFVVSSNTSIHDHDEVMKSGCSSKRKAETTTTTKVRKPRYAFQTRSQVDILDDGYRWRKYGQKAVKNNKFPRSYYRCTHQGCNVKKQVQRLSKDEGVVVTTYEGMHSHPIEKSTDNFEHILTQMQIYTTSF